MTATTPARVFVLPARSDVYVERAGRGVVPDVTREVVDVTAARPLAGRDALRSVPGLGDELRLGYDFREIMVNGERTIFARVRAEDRTPCHCGGAGVIVIGAATGQHYLSRCTPLCTWRADPKPVRPRRPAGTLF